MPKKKCTGCHEKIEKENFNENNRLCDPCLDSFKDKQRNGDIPAQGDDTYLDHI